MFKHEDTLFLTIKALVLLTDGVLDLDDTSSSGLPQVKKSSVSPGKQKRERVCQSLLLVVFTDQSVFQSVVTVQHAVMTMNHELIMIQRRREVGVMNMW
jgi:hypothetical protein